MFSIRICRIEKFFRVGVGMMTQGKTWYISREKGKEGYLHKDLEWRANCTNFNNGYPGWYKSRKEARETLAAWYNKVTKLED